MASFYLSKPHRISYFGNSVENKSLHSETRISMESPHSKGDQSWVFFGRNDALKLKLQYFGHLMRRADSLEKTLMLGGIGGRRRRG